MRTPVLAALAAAALLCHWRLAFADEAEATKQPPPKLDNYGDPLPPGAVLRLGTTRLQSKGSFAWTPDGKTLITLRGGTLYFWDMADGHLQKSLIAPVTSDTFYDNASQFVLSRDGKRLVCTDYYGAIGSWNLETNELRARLPVTSEERQENLALEVSPNGKTFFTLRHTGEVQVRESETCQLLRTISLPAGRFTSRLPIAVSPDGKRLVVGRSSAAIYVVDLEEGGEPAVIARPHGERMLNLLFGPDGQLISTGTAKAKGPAGAEISKAELRFWELDRLKRASVWSLDVTGPGGCSAAFSADGRTMVSVHPDRIAIWDAATRKLLRTIDDLRFWNAMLTNVAIDPTGKFVAVADYYNYVRIWELAPGKPHLSTDRHHQGHVGAIAWHPAGHTIATGDVRGDVFLWNAVSGEPIRRIRGPEWGVFGLSYFGDGARLVHCGDVPIRGGMDEAHGPVCWHDAETGRQLQQCVLPGRAHQVTISPDQSLVGIVVVVNIEGGGGGHVSVLDAATGKERTKITPGHRSTAALGWSPSSKVLAMAGGTNVVRAESETGKILSTVELPHQRRDIHTDLLVPDEIQRAVFLKGGEGIVTCGSSPEIYGWTLPDGEKRWTIKTNGIVIGGLAISPDESLLACIDSEGNQMTKTLRLFDMATRRETGRFDLGETECGQVSFSPDGRRIAVGFYDGTALVYDVAGVAAK